MYQKFKWKPFHITALTLSRQERKCEGYIISENLSQITDFQASPSKPCNNGYYPIHEAAKNASSRTMEVFLQWGESKGCTREKMICLYDAEGNAPLHSAVHGGDIKVRNKPKIGVPEKLRTLTHWLLASSVPRRWSCVWNLGQKYQPNSRITRLLYTWRVLRVQSTSLDWCSLFNRPKNMPVCHHATCRRWRRSIAPRCSTIWKSPSTLSSRVR